MSVTVEVPEPIAGRLEAEARARGLSVEEVALEALTDRYAEPRRKLSFAAIGSSTSGRHAVDAEATLADGGFGVDSADR